MRNFKSSQYVFSPFFIKQIIWPLLCQCRLKFQIQFGHHIYFKGMWMESTNYYLLHHQLLDGRIFASCHLLRSKFSSHISVTLRCSYDMYVSRMKIQNKRDSHKKELKSYIIQKLTLIVAYVEPMAVTISVGIWSHEV